MGFLLQMSARALVGLLAEDVAYGASVIIPVGLILFCIIVINNPANIPVLFLKVHLIPRILKGRVIRTRIETTESIQR